MQASMTDNPLSYYSKASHRERFLYVLHVCRVMSLLHRSSRVCPRVRMPTRQCKSRLGTGYFLFMWCGALVYKGTLRFGALCLSGCLVWCCGLVPGWPFSSWGGWAVQHPPTPTPPPSRTPSRDRVGQMPGALGHTKRLLTWRLGEALRRLLSFCSQKAIFHLSPLFLIFFFLLQLWEVCLCDCTSFSLVFPFPLCFPLWLRHWVHSVQRWVGFRVQRSPPSFLSTPTRRPFHSSLPGS